MKLLYLPYIINYQITHERTTFLYTKPQIYPHSHLASTSSRHRENSLQQPLHPLSLLAQALYCCAKPFSPLAKHPYHGPYRNPAQLPPF